MDTQLSTTKSVGKMANEYAANYIFSAFLAGKAVNTKDAYAADLAHFAAFLRRPDEDCTEDVIKVTGPELAMDPAAWQPVTWGLVAAWQQKQLKDGAAIGSVNRRLACVKRFAKLAHQADAIDGNEALKIAAINSLATKAGNNIDKDRTQTRQSTKRAVATVLTADQVKTLKTHPDTPQGRRDALLMCLLLDHGLRAGELAGLEVTAIDLAAKTLHFWREKVGMWQTHRLSVDTLAAARRWLETDANALGPLFRGSRKGGALTGASMTRVSISERVAYLGAAIGVTISAHDGRHTWATRASKKSGMVALRDAGGWKSLTMPNRYIEASKIANEGIVLD